MATYLVSIVYRTPNLERPSPGFRGPKQAHPLDPLIWHLIRAWAASDPDPWPASLAALERTEDLGHLVEAVVVEHLRRCFGDRVFYWRPDARREIDFVLSPPRGKPVLGEVKYRRQVSELDARVLAQNGGGVLLTRDFVGELASGAVIATTTAEFLAMLDAPSLGRARPW